MANYYYKFQIISFIILFLLPFCESTDLKLKIGENMPVIVFDPSGHLEKFHGLSLNRNIDLSNQAENNQLPTTPPNSTLFDKCLIGKSADCCYKFTWPGFVSDYQKYYSNSSCARYKNDKNFPKMACYDPLVFTNDSGRPDLEHLRKYCLDNCRQISIHCARASGQTCIKYSYFRDNQLVNETRFCGTVSDSDSSSQIRTGCFRQKILSSSLEREVCTCKGVGDDGYPCNWGYSKYIINLNMFIISLTITITYLCF